MSDNGEDLRELASAILKRARLPEDQRLQPSVMLWHYRNGEIIERRPVSESGSVDFDPGTDRHECYWLDKCILITGMDMDGL